MMMHPFLMLALADERRRELIGDVDRERALAAARAARRSRRSRKVLPVRGQPTGIVTSCEPAAAVPAR